MQAKSYYLNTYAFSPDHGTRKKKKQQDIHWNSIGGERHRDTEIERHRERMRKRETSGILSWKCIKNNLHNNQKKKKKNNLQSTFTVCVEDE